MYMWSKIQSIFNSCDFPAKVIITLYFLFSFWLVLSLAGWFFGWIVVASLMIFGWLWVSAYRKERNDTFDVISKIVILFVPFMVLGFALLRGHYTGDAYAYWLPWASELSQYGVMPNWIERIGMPYTSAGPIWPLALGAFFTFLPLNQFSVSFLPPLFFILGLLVLISWMKKKDFSRGYMIVALIFILWNSQTAFWSWNLLVESSLFLGFVLFFYFFEKVWGELSERNWYLLIGSFVFVVLVKFSSLLLVLPLLILLLRHRRSLSVKRLSTLIVIAAPLLIWFGRNYVVYDNPVFPLLTGLFQGQYAEIYGLTDPFLYWSERYESISSRALFIIRQLFSVFPLVVLAAIGFWYSKFRVPYFAVLIAAISAGILFIFSVSSGMRYLWPFLGLFAVYATLAIRDLKKPWLKTIALLVAFWAVLQVKPVFALDDFISNIEQTFNFLGRISLFVHKNWIIAVILSIPLGYYIAKRQFIWQLSVVGLIATSMLHLIWLEERSFLVTWSFILFIFILIFVFAIFKTLQSKRKLLLMVLGAYLMGIFLFNSYMQAGVYYWRQGEVVWPHSFVYSESSLLEPLIEERNESADGVLLALDSSEYYTWFKPMPVVTLNSFGFVQKTGRLFEPSMDAASLRVLLNKANISIVYKEVAGHNDPIAYELEKVLDSNASFFKKTCIEGTAICLWEVEYDK